MIEGKKNEYIAENFRTLQGLRAIPFGVYFLFTSVTNSRDSLWSWAGDNIFAIPVALIAVLANILIGKYYSRTYGYVKKKRETNLEEGLLVVSIYMLISFFNSIYPHFYYSGLMLAYWCIIGWWIRKGHLHKHYLVMGILFAVISSLPVLNIIPIEVLQKKTGFFFAAVFIFGGLIDHFILVRHLHPVPEESNDAIV